MDDSGLAYSLADCTSFGEASGLSPDIITRMWIESEPVVEGDADATNYGNWSGDAVRPTTNVLIAQRYGSKFEPSQPLVRKSWSAGNLTEMGRSTVRHEDEHPTAYGAGKSYP